MLIARRNSRSAKPQLYHWEPNANSGKPIIALLEKGVAFESRYTDMLEFDHHKPAYLSINPDGTIPTLVHGDSVFTESTEMGEYIDAAFPDEPVDAGRLEVEKMHLKMKNDIKAEYARSRGG